MGEIQEPTPELASDADLSLRNVLGGFSKDGRSYVIRLEAGEHTPAPWCNVLSNAEFGCLVSEAGFGATWSQNSAERRLTPWHNDPVSDEPAEAVYIRDEETGVFWSPTPHPAGDAVPSRIEHGAGWSDFQQASHGLVQSLRVSVPRFDPLKVVSLRLRNSWSRPRRLTVTYYADLVLGRIREESAPFITHEYDPDAGVLLARNPWDPESAERVTFLASDLEPHGVTVDRHEFLGRNGNLKNPAALQRWGLSNCVRAGLDPCQALMIHVELAPGQEGEVHFFFGDGANGAHALELVRRFRQEEERTRAQEELEVFWNGLLGAVQVETPEPAMNLALNHWLLYEAVACRLQGRTGFYQSSGAFGFRDQLQDVLALVHGAPQMARSHVLEAASRQFEAGDVLHWWQPSVGGGELSGVVRGVRTRCSDDLLWLPFVAAHYALATGDLAIFEERIPFLEGEPLNENEVESYGTYAWTSSASSLLDHCRRAVSRGTTRGPHGLPLIGSCDWNDGFNRVGIRGDGESVWLAWFLVATLRSFASVLEQLGNDEEEAREHRRRADELVQSVERTAWDGDWYLRAWYDDGAPMGSAKSSECRIDLIAQAWAAISGGGAPERVAKALEAVRSRLVDEEHDLVRLLWPPFDADPRDPGYIKAYPPGVRENGGQYTHAATWLGWALASQGDGAGAERIFRKLNPLLRGSSSADVQRYRVEPYVVAADVYGSDPHTGRGGWTWYTGAAAWLWRLGIESILGLRRSRGDLVIEPCIPPDWSGFRAVVRTAACRCEIAVENPDGIGRGVASVQLDGEEIPDGRIPLGQLSGEHTVSVRLSRSVAAKGTSSAAEPSSRS